MTLNAAHWAQQIIRAAREDHGRHLPTYGSDAWSTLAAPQRWASALIAAESWRQESDPAFILERLNLELNGGPRLAKQIIDARFTAAARDHSDRWRTGTYKPTTEDRQRLAAEIETEWRQWTGGDAA